MIKLHRLTILTAALSLLAGCVVGHDYVAPQQVGNIEIDASYEQAMQANTWWQAFDDTELNRLIA
jgi:outer membrane protein TolC